MKKNIEIKNIKKNLEGCMWIFDFNTRTFYLYTKGWTLLGHYHAIPNVYIPVNPFTRREYSRAAKEIFFDLFKIQLSAASEI